MPNTLQTIAIFASRGTDRRRAVQILAASAVFAVALVAISYWLSGAWAVECEQYRGPAGKCADLVSLRSIVALADNIAIILVAAAHLVLIPAFVAAGVGAERRNGTLDQLRTTPVEPRALLAGFVFGRPAIIYLGLTGFWLIHCLAALVGARTLRTVVESSAVIIFGGLATSMIGATYALLQERKSAGLAALVVVALAAPAALLCAALPMANGRNISWPLFHPAGALVASYGLMESWYSLTPLQPWAPYLATVLSAALFFLVAKPAYRRLQAPLLPLLRYREAFVLFVIAAGIVILPVPTSSFNEIAVVGGGMLLPVMALLVLLSQPSTQRWLFALRRRSVTVPWLPVTAMLAVFWGLVLLKAGRIEDNAPVTVLWLSWLGLFLGQQMHFAKARFPAASSRLAFLLTSAVVFGLQLAALVQFIFGGHRLDSVEKLLVEAGLAATVAMPLWVGWRLRALRKRSLRAPPPNPSQSPFARTSPYCR
jgi:hypothetical protein